jgi:hypothetical protein
MARQTLPPWVRPGGNGAGDRHERRDMRRASALAALVLTSLSWGVANPDPVPAGGLAGLPDRSGPGLRERTARVLRRVKEHVRRGRGGCRHG